MNVAIIMGSASDRSVMANASAVLEEFGIPYKMWVCSAHRNPYRLMNIITDEYDVFIAGAGMSAHLAGVVAAHTSKPVIGVPISSDTFSNGLDALLSTVQMPPGIPVATVAVNGAKNAALLAIQILAVRYYWLHKKLVEYRANMSEKNYAEL